MPTGKSKLLVPVEMIERPPVTKDCSDPPVINPDNTVNFDDETDNMPEFRISSFVISSLLDSTIALLFLFSSKRSETNSFP